MPDVADRIFFWLQKRASRTATRKLRADGLLNAVVSALELDLVEAREGFRELRRRQLVEYLLDTNGLPYAGYLTVAVSDPVEPASAVAWRECLLVRGVDAGLAEALSPAHEWLADLDDQDIETLADGLIALQGDQGRSGRSFGFAISARHLLGSSKILDRLPRAARERLGVANLPSTPRYVVVAGPAHPAAVLLIENTTTFELAVRTGLDETQALVAAYGYGLNMQSDSTAGWALVESIQRGGYEILARTGGGHDLARLLMHSQVRLWGDLDMEGLRIAHALRGKIPQLVLSALYKPMHDLLKSRSTSHPYVRSAGKENQSRWSPTGDLLLDTLGKACSTRAVDQEALDLEAYRGLAEHALQIQDLVAD